MKKIRFCKYCGQEFSEHAKFCPKCGKEIVRKTVIEKNVKESQNNEGKNKDTSKNIDFGNIKENIGKNVKQGAENIKFSNGSFYVLDLFKRLLNPRNIPIAIYMIMNLCIVCFFFALFGMDSTEQARQMLVVGVVVYFGSLALALSPVGEFVLRIQAGCSKLERPEQINRIEPLFNEVYEKAKLNNPGIPNDVKLYIKHEDSVNAFATGRKTICIMEGLLDCEDEIIKATLSHEFGHLAHKDTDLILLVSVGNLIVTVVLVIVRLFIALFHFIFGLGALFAGGKDGLVVSIGNLVASILTTIFITAFEWFWTKIGILLVMKSSRENEYAADEFALELGYGNALCELLDSLDPMPEKGLFANLASSHPNKNKRIERLQSKGCNYSKTYGSGMET